MGSHERAFMGLVSQARVTDHFVTIFSKTRNDAF